MISPYPAVPPHLLIGTYNFIFITTLQKDICIVNGSFVMNSSKNSEIFSDLNVFLEYIKVILKNVSLYYRVFDLSRISY